ncbi:MAG: Lrp/AsnC family transcriptional regulator [Lachnospiraceae bacterium]|nr:Lrp/AsnC family transcriptional regulator [Lachnospiraceae bacterium]
MDHIDRQIVSILQKNARTPLKVIAEKAFLSSPAVSARIERLEKAGIITGYCARVNVEQLGYHIMAFINLEVQPKQKNQFYPFIEACPNVLECNCVTGQFSMLIKVAFKSTMELDQFIGRLQDYGRTSTQIVFSTPVGPRGIRLLGEEEEEVHGGKDGGKELHGGREE